MTKDWFSGLPVRVSVVSRNSDDETFNPKSHRRSLPLGGGSSKMTATGLSGSSSPLSSGTPSGWQLTVAYPGARCCKQVVVGGGGGVGRRAGKAPPRV